MSVNQTNKTLSGVTSLYTEHLSLLRAVYLAMLAGEKLDLDASCGADDVADSIAKLIDSNGYCILTPDGKNVVPNPKLFDPLPLGELDTDDLRIYTEELSNLRSKMEKILPGNLVPSSEHP